MRGNEIEAAARGSSDTSPRRVRRGTRGGALTRDIRGLRTGTPRGLWLIPLGVLLASPPAAAATPSVPGPCPACITWEATPSQARELLDRPVSLEGLELLVRVGPVGLEGIPSLLEDLADRGASPGLILEAGGFVSHAVPAARTVILALSPSRDGHDPDDEAFRLKTLATELRARDVGVIGVEGDASTIEALWARGVAAYLDFAVQSTANEAPGTKGAGGLDVWQRVDRPLSLNALLSATLAAPGRILARWNESAAELALTLQRLRKVLPEALTRASEVAVRCETNETSETGATSPASPVFMDPESLDALALVECRQHPAWVTVSPGARKVELYDLDNASGPVSLGPAPLTSTRGGVRLQVDRNGPVLLKIAGWKGGEEDRFHSDVDVTAQPVLSVEEVVARYQAREARDRRDVTTLISTGTMALAFQVPGLAAPVSISADTVLYKSAEASEVEQRSIRLNGALIEDGGVPRLPLIEPERVTAPPLAITLNDSYRYRLEGREVVRGTDCYVVGFEPRDAGARQSLFRGRAWIASDGFALVRIESAQTGLRGPIVASEQRDEFGPVPFRGRTVWFLVRSDVHQVYEGAGHRTSIERAIRIERHEPEPPDFASRLAAAHASRAVMLRDTPEGFRYLRREDGAEARRVLAGRAERVLTLTFGALLDPGIDQPLPFVGLGYVDFDFLGTGAQMNGFVGGAFVRAAWAVPSLAGSRWQLQAAAYSSLVEYNDRVFRKGVEQYEESLRQRPTRASLGVVRPLSARSRIKAGYEIAYTRLARSSLTAADFAVPASPLEHGLRFTLEAQARAWTTSLWWNPAWRQRWDAWGFPGSPEAGRGTDRVHRFGASAFRTFVLSPRVQGRIEVAWMGGRRLDRFSRYGFDQIENFLHGYPSAGLRYDRGGVVRSTFCWSPGRGLRLSAFVDGAHVHDPDRGARSRPYTGVGAALDTALPWGLRVTAEWGYGLQGHDREGKRGTHVLRLMAYRIL